MDDDALTVKEGVAVQLAEALKEKRISKNRMAAMLGTSRTQVDRLLNRKDDITLGSLERAAAAVGLRVTIELVGGEAWPERDMSLREPDVSRDGNAPDTSAVAEEDSGWLG